MNQPQYLTVRALTKYIKRKFDADPHLADVFVKGEISNFKRHTSGHLYFTLKDESARIMAVMFSSAAKSVRFKPENGMKILLRGSITVYESSGQYQMYVKEMQPDGIGDLFLAFEQLREKLDKEGLFAQERKRRLPAFPRTIGVITSPTGAAIRDIVTTIQRRFPIGKILLIPALVQGEHAAEAVASSIRKANKHGEADVLIVGRGGGSIEELWAFNEEKVARAIFESAIPVISAVGHETDFTIADFVADVRAATPTAAAELAVPHIEDIMERLLNMQNRLFRGMAEISRDKRRRLGYLEQSYIFRNPHKLYEQKWEAADRMTERLHEGKERLLRIKREALNNRERVLVKHHPAMKLELAKSRLSRAQHGLQQQAKHGIQNKSRDFAKLAATLEALSPLAILGRGYSVAYTDEGKLFKHVEQVAPGDALKVKVGDGTAHCTVDQIEKGEN